MKQFLSDAARGKFHWELLDHLLDAGWQMQAFEVYGNQCRHYRGPAGEDISVWRKAGKPYLVSWLVPGDPPEAGMCEIVAGEAHWQALGQNARRLPLAGGVRTRLLWSALAVLCAFLLMLLGKGMLKEPATSGTTVPAAPSPAASSERLPPPEPEATRPGSAIAAANSGTTHGADFLPSGALKRTFEAMDSAGASSRLELWSLNQNGDVLEVEDSGGFRLNRTYVVLEGEVRRDGELWLPRDLKEGDHWKQFEADYRVVEVGGSLDLGFMILKNVLVIEVDSPRAKTRERVYYSPGLGEVLTTDLEQPGVQRKLTSVELVDEEQVRALAR